MHEYIRRSDAIAEIRRGDLLVGNFAEWAEEVIWRTPYSNVEEVKYAYWIEKHFNSFGCSTFTCSRCGFGATDKTKYCPDCGARMKR